MLKNLSYSKTIKTTVFVLILALFAKSTVGQFQNSINQKRNSQNSDDILATQELINLGRLTEAEKIIRSKLQKTPRNAQWRFLNAVLLAENAISKKNNSSNLVDEAIENFERFSEEFPELAEPLNNLAVLYLFKGQVNNARDVLEKAIINNENYNLAYENLGDLYVYLANKIYKKGLSKSPQSLRLNKKLDYLNSMPFLTQPNIIINLKNQ